MKGGMGGGNPDSYQHPDVALMVPQKPLAIDAGGFYHDPCRLGLFVDWGHGAWLVSSSTCKRGEMTAFVRLERSPVPADTTSEPGMASTPINTSGKLPEGDKSCIHVAEYLAVLPLREVLKGRLHQAMSNARARLAARGSGPGEEADAVKGRHRGNGALEDAADARYSGVDP